jgi:hypothetical protein
LTSDNAINVRRGHGRADTTEVIQVKQIGVAIFAQREHQLRRGGTRDIDEYRAAPAEINIAVIE